MIHNLGIAVTGGASVHPGDLSPGNGFSWLSIWPVDGRPIGIERFLRPSRTIFRYLAWAFDA